MSEQVSRNTQDVPVEIRSHPWWQTYRVLADTEVADLRRQLAEIKGSSPLWFSFEEYDNLRRQLAEAQAERDEIINGWPYDGNLGGKSLAQAVQDDFADYQMIIRHCTEIYLAASSGQVSKPNTLPSVVITLMEDRQAQEVKEAVNEATSAAEAELATLRARIGDAQDMLMEEREELETLRALVDEALDDESMLT